MLGASGDQPHVSVIIPAFNEPVATLTESLESVRAQTFTDFECIVVDESTDPEAAAACAEFCSTDTRFTYVHPATRLGLAASLNLGISLARAPLIARFDSDDLCMARRLELQVAFMVTHPDVGVLGGAIEIMSDDGETIAFRSYPADDAEIRRKFHMTSAIAHPAVMIRKELIALHGGYDPAFRFSEDLDLWLRLLNKRVRFANLGDILIRYRQQDTRRNSLHWRYNIKARLKNFTMRHSLPRLAGLCGIVIWGSLPGFFQKKLFHSLLLRNDR